MALHLQLLHLPIPSTSSSSPSETLASFTRYHPSLHHKTANNSVGATISLRRRHVSFVGKEKSEFSVSIAEQEAKQQEEQLQPQPQPQPLEDADPEDLECIRQIQRVLKLLKKNRDMLFNEVKLTIMIEDPREVERRRLLGLDDPGAATRDDLVDALVDVNEGRIPENRVALRMLADEMINWPNLEVEVSKKKPRKSLYAKATDTGVKPEVAAQRLKVDWDTAAEIEDFEGGDNEEVPSAVGYGALYLVTGFPIIIGISVVLILFYNSLQ